MNNTTIDNDPFAGELGAEISPSPVKPANAKSVEERAANQKALDGASGLFPEVAGVQLSPFSMARASFLRRLNNPFISGVKFSEIDDPFMAVGEFLLMCSVSISEGRKLLSNKQELEDRALAILDKVNALNISEVMEAIVDYTTSELSAKVEAESKTEDSSSDNEPGN